MENIVILEWTFSPPDYFEEAVHVESEGYTITIDNGNVEARIDSAIYDPEHKLRDVLHDAVNDRFLGVQLLTHKPYNLSKASMYRLDAEGRKHITVFPESIVSIMTFGTVDLVVKDRDGNILSDSRRDRIEKKKELAELIVKYRQHDEFVASMLGFYEASIHDSRNELVHLFDIWEALVKRFGDEKTVKATLAISDSQQRKLGILANNDEPFHQGRHRGKKVGELRDATESELEEARSIARKMIEGYLQYLESQKI